MFYNINILFLGVIILNKKESYKMSTEEAKKLIDMLKERVSTTNLFFPTLGKKIEFDVFAKKESSRFIVNISRGSINHHKCTYQGRTHI